MGKTIFEWDEAKDLINQEKHGVSFELAQRVFDDPQNVIMRDVEHEYGEKRFYCFGKVDDQILTVRFSYRHKRIRIYGAGYWRKGRKTYEKENKLYQ